MSAAAPHVHVEVMVTAEVPMANGYVFRPAVGPQVVRVASALRPGGEVVRAPCLAFAVRHPEAGTILVDTGMHPDVGAGLRRDFGAPLSLVFRGLRPRAAFDEQLRGLDIEAGSVEQVVMTHLHADHTSGMRLLDAATFTCSREEWTAAHARLAVRNGYLGHHLPPKERVRAVDFAAAGLPWGPFSSTIDLLGDGTVRLVSTPGHTAGHLSVLLRLDGGRLALVAGDAAYTLRSVREQILPLLAHDDDASLRSLDEIRAFMDAEPDAIVIPTHDPQAWRALAGTDAGVAR